MHLRVLVGAALLAVSVAGCGNGTTQPGATQSSTPTPQGSGSATLVTPQGTASGSPSTPRPTTTPSPKSSTGSVRVVGRDDSGSTVELKVGESFRVELDANYQPATARPDGVLERTSETGGYPTGQPMIAVFKAIAAGQADVESTTDYACLHATPRCALPQQLWMVHVVVKAP